MTPNNNIDLLYEMPRLPLIFADGANSHLQDSTDELHDKSSTTQLHSKITQLQ